jgi:hypothetical protein
MVSKPATSRADRLPVSPAVLWTGIAVGVFLAVEAMVHGLVLPLSLGLLVNAALTFLLIVALAVVLGELTRRHHRTVLWGVRRHGGSALGWLAAKAGTRWEGRARGPLLFRRLLHGEQEGPATGGQPEKAAGPSYSFGHAGQRAAGPVPSLEEATANDLQ